MPEWAWRALWDLSAAGDIDGITALLQTLLDNGSITQAEAADFYDRAVSPIEDAQTTTPEIPPINQQGTVAPLPPGVTLTGERKFIGENEYAQGSDGKWYQIALTPAEAERIAAINYLKKQNAKAQADYEKALAQAEKEARRVEQEEQEEQTRAAREAEQAALNAVRNQRIKDTYLPGLKRYLDAAVKQGVITQEQADSQYNYESSLIDKGYDLPDLPNYATVEGLGWIVTPEQRVAEDIKTQREMQRRTQEGQRRVEEQKTALALRQKEDQARETARLAALAKEQQGLPWLLGIKPAPSEQPSYESVYEPFLAGIGAPNFRQFIASRLGRIAEEAAPARAKWWEQKRTLEDLLGGSYQEAKARLQGGIERIGSLLQNPEIDPRTGISWQESQMELKAQQEKIASMGPSGFEAYRQTQLEDPFQQALKAYPFLGQFMELSPQERGFQKQRFAPRVQYRGM